MKRWPIIRHVRWWFLRREFCSWWGGFGRHHWITPNPADLDYLDRVWRGET